MPALWKGLVHPGRHANTGLSDGSGTPAVGHMSTRASRWRRARPDAAFVLRSKATSQSGTGEAKSGSEPLTACRPNSRPCLNFWRPPAAGTGTLGRRMETRGDGTRHPPAERMPHSQGPRADLLHQRRAARSQRSGRCAGGRGRGVEQQADRVPKIKAPWCDASCGRATGRLQTAVDLAKPFCGLVFDIARMKRRT